MANIGDALVALWELANEDERAAFLAALNDHEHERAMIQERVRAALRRAKADGKPLGRPKS